MTARYMSQSCTSGACSACPTPAFCAHECHVDGLVRAVEVVPDPMIHVENPAFTALVEARGEKLCLTAEPHSHSPATTAPCEVHWSEARRTVMGQWLGQQGAVA